MGQPIREYYGVGVSVGVDVEVGVAEGVPVAVGVSVIVGVLDGVGATPWRTIRGYTHMAKSSPLESLA